jgi:hypothetical protein
MLVQMEVDQYGRTDAGGFVLTKDSFAALQALLLRRCGPNDVFRVPELCKAADDLGKVIFQSQGLDFQQYT